MIKIRLFKVGRKNIHSYRIVVSNNKSPRDGKFIEKIGFINKNKNKYIFFIDKNRYNYWIKIGSKVSKRIIFFIKKNNNN